METFSASQAIHKGQWRGALMISLICARINGWINNREAGDLRRHRTHYNITVMIQKRISSWNRHATSNHVLYHIGGTGYCHPRDVIIEKWWKTQTYFPSNQFSAYRVDSIDCCLVRRPTQFWNKCSHNPHKRLTRIKIRVKLMLCISPTDRFMPPVYLLDSNFRVSILWLKATIIMREITLSHLIGQKWWNHTLPL